MTSVLQAAIDGNSKTKIMYDAYLSFSQLKDYLAVLQENGLLEYNAEEKIYKTTRKGTEFLVSNDRISKMFSPIKEE
jgi:predicted transcriptional regulator